jgi:hypothetical protein
VVRYGLSDNDERPAVADHLGRSPVGSLTQELTQLLAASIAQNQANKGGAPTNAELTSLANLVSAAVARRTIPPAFKDGLSTLSYRQPRPALAPQPGAAPPLGLGHDDEPMPIPSTWRQPLAQDDDRWFRQQMCAAVLGLAAGLLIVVPAVLCIGGFFSPQKSETAARWAVPAAADARTAPEARNVEQPVAAKSPPLLPTIAAARVIDSNQARIDGLLTQAAQRIENGDIAGAREMLAGTDDGGQGAVSFALAETYDPNMLAAWGTRGVVADAAKARVLYRKAFSLGVAEAQNRLDALRP